MRRLPLSLSIPTATLLAMLLTVPAAAPAGPPEGSAPGPREGAAGPGQQDSDLGPGLEKLVQRVQERYQDVGGLEARFRQRSLGRFGGVAKEASGVVTIRPPGNMRMEYDDGQLFVVSGDEMILWRPGRNQAQIYPFDRERVEDTPVLYLSGEGDLLRDFHIEPASWQEPLAPDHVQLRLTPRRTESRIEALILEIEPMSARVARLVQMEAVGSTVDYQFHDVRYNIDVPDGAFRFEIPEGADVVRVGG